MDPQQEAPTGYTVFDQHSPVTAAWAPIYVQEDATRVCLAIRVGLTHCNSRGFAHGGLLCTLADLAMGRTALSEARRRGLRVRSGVTSSLHVDYLETAAQGEIVEWLPEVLRCGTTLSVIECRIVSGSRLIARAGATFAMTP